MSKLDVEAIRACTGLDDIERNPVQARKDMIVLCAEVARLRVAQTELLRIIGDAAKHLPEAAEAMIALAGMAVGAE